MSIGLEGLTSPELRRTAASVAISAAANVTLVQRTRTWSTTTWTGSQWH